MRLSIVFIALVAIDLGANKSFDLGRNSQFARDLPIQHRRAPEKTARNWL
jgi:hypothetical protein